MSTEEYKSIVRRFFEEGLNHGNLALAYEPNAPNGSTMILMPPTFAPSKTTNNGSPRSAALPRLPGDD